MRRKYKSITVKQKDNKKLYKKLYYQIAVKPFRKPKTDHDGHGMYACPLCNKRSFMVCFRDAVKTLSIKVLFFKGYKNIEVMEVPGDNSQYVTFKNLLKQKVIGLVSWLGITAEELGIKIDDKVVVSATPQFNQTSTTSIRPKIAVSV